MERGPLMLAGSLRDARTNGHRFDRAYCPVELWWCVGCDPSVGGRTFTWPRRSVVCLCAFEPSAFLSSDALLGFPPHGWGAGRRSRFPRRDFRVHADNRLGLRDENGEAGPWIELHNGSTATINLNGWSLTDTATNLTKWRFPGVTLLPDKYVVIRHGKKSHEQPGPSAHQFSA